MSGAEYTPAVKLKEHEHVGAIKVTEQKVKLSGEEVKVKLQSYLKQYGEAFLWLVVDFWNMKTTYSLFTGAENIVFDWFRSCLKSPARNDWDTLVTGVTLI